MFCPYPASHRRHSAKAVQNWDTPSLSTFSLYILSPALIFDTLLHAEITWTDVTGTFWFSIINLIALWALAELLSRIFHLGASEKQDSPLSPRLQTV